MGAMSKAVCACVFAGMFLVAGPVFGQDDNIKTITFEDDTIEGELMAPNQANISVKEFDELSSLIRAREDFVDEMRKTVDEL